MNENNNGFKKINIRNHGQNVYLVQNFASFKYTQKHTRHKFNRKGN